MQSSLNCVRILLAEKTLNGFIGLIDTVTAIKRTVLRPICHP